MKSGPRSPQLEKDLAQKWRPNTAKNLKKKKKKKKNYSWSQSKAGLISLALIMYIGTPRVLIYHKGPKLALLEVFIRNLRLDF